MAVWPCDHVTGGRSATPGWEASAFWGQHPSDDQGRAIITKPGRVSNHAGAPPPLSWALPERGPEPLPKCPRAGASYSALCCGPEERRWLPALMGPHSALSAQLLCAVFLGSDGRAPSPPVRRLKSKIQVL